MFINFAILIYNCNLRKTKYWDVLLRIAVKLVLTRGLALRVFDSNLLITNFSPMIRTCQRCVYLQWKGIRQQSTSVKDLLADKTTGKDVTITGWINHKRKLKNATFLDITDGSTYQSVQVVAGTTPET